MADLAQDTRGSTCRCLGSGSSGRGLIQFHALDWRRRGARTRGRVLHHHINCGIRTRCRGYGKRETGLERLKASGKGGEWCKTAAEAIKLQLGSQRGRGSESEGSRLKLIDWLGWRLNGRERSSLRRGAGCLGTTLRESGLFDFQLLKLLVCSDVHHVHWYRKDGKVETIVRILGWMLTLPSTRLSSPTEKDTSFFFFFFSGSDKEKDLRARTSEASASPAAMGLTREPPFRGPGAEYYPALLVSVRRFLRPVSRAFADCAIA